MSRTAQKNTKRPAPPVFFSSPARSRRSGLFRAPARAFLLSPTGIVSRPRASAFFVSDGPISSNSGRNGGKNAGRNCVSALPQRATVGCDFPRILADITFHHRCQSKGLCLRSPARRLTRPLASATAGVFRSYRRPLQAFPSSGAPPQAFPLDGFAVLNDTPVACQTRGPTRRETGAPISRRR